MKNEINIFLIPGMSLSESIAVQTDGDIFFTKNGQDYIKKFVNGEWVTKKAIKDPNYKGHRYITEDELCR